MKKEREQAVKDMKAEERKKDEEKAKKPPPKL